MDMNNLVNRFASQYGGNMPSFGGAMPVMEQGPSFGAAPVEMPVQSQEPTFSTPEGEFVGPKKPTREEMDFAKRQAEFKRMQEKFGFNEDGIIQEGKYAGERWYGPETKAWVRGYGIENIRKKPELMQELEYKARNEARRYSGLDPIEMPTKTDTSVNPVFQEHLQKKRAEKTAGFMDELEKDIAIQNDVITNADAFDSLMKNEGLKTGVGQDVLDTTARWLERLGVDTSFLTGANRPATADALRQQVQTNVMNVLAAQKGVQTEGDAQRARETWVRLQNTPEGNLWINQYMKNIAQRKMDRANFILDEMERNGGNVRAAQNAWQKHAKELPSVAPLVPEAPKKPQGEQPGRVEGTPGFNKPQKPANDESEWEDI